MSSEQGEGTTFTLEVVAEVRSDADLEPKPSRQRVLGLARGQSVPTVLVVDDKPLNRQLLRELLEGVGLRCIEAADGVEALERFVRDEPDLILMDVKMPRMDGIEATMRIRELEARDERTSTPVVVLTASVFEEDRRAAADAGADALLMKPIEEEYLWHSMEWLLDIEFEREEEPESDPVGETPAWDGGDLSALGADVLTGLRRAVDMGDLDRASELISPLDEEAPELVAHLRRLIQGYEYDRLSDLLEPTGGG